VLSVPAAPRVFAQLATARRFRDDVAAMAGSGEEVLSVEVDMSVVSAYRTSFPVLRDRRLPLGSNERRTGR